jgi:diketogulonate reductase-like aldo/keto reductase
MVLEALKNGYRYLDTAQQYRNAGSVGEAIKRWGGKREDVYILTKCASQGVMSTSYKLSNAWVRRALEASLLETHCGDTVYLGTKIG